ncbi:MAG TPA: nitroreductase [Rhodocyclaceae bacterium]|nr:nitroreductase [Rhodocyclaceae bacterium]
MSEPARSPGTIGPSSREVVDQAVTSRRSVRAFLPTPVPRATVEAILAVASRAPSGSNHQPWRVHVLSGAAKARLSARILAAHDAGDHGSWPDDYYPAQWPEPYLARRRQLGWALYGTLGIGRGEKARMHHQHGRNYLFFDAPVGMIFTIDRRLGRGSWLDYGMFLENVMIAARGHGLDTCAQAAFVPYADILHEELALGVDECIVCGMALGYADPAAPENTLRSEREPVAAMARFMGWD